MVLCLGGALRLGESEVDDEDEEDELEFWRTNALEVPPRRRADITRDIPLDIATLAAAGSLVQRSNTT